MKHPRPRRVLVGLAICMLLVTGTALARRVVVHTYKGKTAQTDQRTGRKFVITFKLSNRHVYAVDTAIRDLCPDGTHLRVHENAFQSTTLDVHDRFTLTAGTRQQPAVLKGKITGGTASGTLSDKTFDTAGSGLCKASTTWSASRIS